MALICFLLSGISLSHAHTRWVSPAPRAGENVNTAPCDGTPNYSNPPRYVAGDSVVVTFDEYINHSGYFKIYISYDKGVTLKALDSIPDMSSGVLTRKIKIPSQSGDSVILKLVQYYGNAQYYSCADIKVVSATTSTVNSKKALHQIRQHKRIVLHTDHLNRIIIKNNNHVYDFRGRPIKVLP